MGIMVREMGMVLLEIRGQGQGNFRGTFHGRGRGQGRFDKSPNVICPRVAIKTVDKDKMRCHYFNDFGHVIIECSKRSTDEKEAWHFSGMNSDYYKNGRYDDVYDEDYDDEVFATLNR